MRGPSPHASLYESAIVPSNFEEGLNRVAKPVLSNPRYEDILGTRVDTFFDRYATVMPKGRISSEQALAILDRTLCKKRALIQILPPRLAVAYGRTSNNLREFGFLKSFLRRNGLDDRLFNSAFVQPKPSSKLSEQGRLVGIVREGFADFVSKKEVGRPALFQLINYVHAYLSWSHSFQYAGSPPRVLVFANDHSPLQVACSMVAKELGLPRIYIQHAEVTTAFPELDFEVSILRNRASLQTYQEIGQFSGHVHVVSREETPLNLSGFATANSDEVTVGVYLTAQVDWHGVQRAIERLKGNGQVRSLFVKPHPSIPVQQVQQECPSVPVSTGVPEQPHIAVVANSSVVIELLHRGIPVFQYYGMDAVPDDYYGFSRRGIAPQLTMEDLQRRFWTDFDPDEAWLAEFERYDPWADPGHTDEEARLVRSLSRYFPKRKTGRRPNSCASMYDGASSKTEAQLAGAKSHFSRLMLTVAPNSTIDVLNESRRFCVGRWSPSVTEVDFVTSFEALFAERSAAAHEVFSATRRVRDVRSELVYSVKRRDIELSGRNTSDQELDQMVAYVLSNGAEPNQRWRADIQFLLFLLRLGLDKRIERFLAEAPPIIVENLHVNHRIAIVKWLRERLTMQAALNLLPTQLYEGLSAFHRLKLQVLSATESMFERQPWTHGEIEDRFLGSASSGARRDFEHLVKPCYDRLRDRLFYMDVRWSRNERGAFFDAVATALRRKTPFSLVRLSDGEGYIFGEAYRHFTEIDMKNRERHWWREELSEDLRRRILPEIRAAAENADVLGIPCVYRFLRDSTDKSSSLLSSLQGRGLVEVLSRVSEYSRDDQLFAEEKCNLPLFNDLQRIYDLASLAERVVVVASVTPEEIVKLFGSLAERLYIQIPTHSRTVGNHKYSSHDKTLPHVYSEIREEITRTVRPGDLVLVAAGVIGKIFLGDAKRCGGVALDVGSSLDEWVEAGIHSLH